MAGHDPDRDEAASEEDLWFLPGPIEEPDTGPPLPRADRRALFDPAEWRAAQDALSGPLARLALVFGELDARLRGSPQGLRQRLALREAADLSWWTGDRLSAERLGLWVGLQTGSTGDTEQALARAGWAFRRLSGGPAPADGLGAFLERPDGVATRARGAIAELAGLLASLEALHPVVQALALFQAWRLLGPERSCDGEAAVLAARHAAGMSRLPGQGALFLPLAMTGARAFRGQGEPLRKLRAWIGGAEQATLAALMELERVSEWRCRAEAATAGLSGRTPARLLDVIASWRLVNARLAEAETGASRAAVRRNLALLAERGLVREVTGQGRYRVWMGVV